MFGPPMLSNQPKKKRTGPTPEKLVQKAIQDAFRLRYRVALVHVDSGAAGMRRGQGAGQGGYSATPAGFPDLVGVLPPSGRAVYVEVKAPGNRPTDIQTMMLAALRSKGAIAFWADSVASALAQFEEHASQPSAAELHMVAQIREALGDNGRRMFPDLLTWCRELVKGRAA